MKTLARAVLACTLAAGASQAAEDAAVEEGYMTWLIADEQLLSALADRIPETFRTVPRSELDAEALLQGMAQGDDAVWIGSPEGLPPDLWIGSYRPAGEAALAVAPAASSPLPLPELAFEKSTLHSAFILSPKDLPKHNVDEEPRADFLPILEARDRVGRPVGYPGVLMSYYAPSLAARRFAGSELFLFLFDKPAEALSVEAWADLLGSIDARLRTGLQVTACDTDYATYYDGERVRIRVRLRNDRDEAVACVIRFSAKAPGADGFTPITTARRAPEGGDETEAVCDFVPGSEPGLWQVRVEVLADPDRAELLAVVGEPRVLDRRDIGFMRLGRSVETPDIVAVDGPRIRIDGQDAFWAGTHYYPSSSWWEWVWRDYRPFQAASDFEGIRRAGYRIARVWIDPIIDETVLRAMDAAIVEAARHGIVLDICLFTQWTREMGYEGPDGQHVRWDFRDPRDFNLVSLSLRHLDHQRAFAAVVARRWKDAGNVVFNLANEAYVRDPDLSQMDPEVAAWPEAQMESGALRDSLLFRRWARELTEAIRAAGARQPVLPGYMFSTEDGGDNFVCNYDGDIVPWHSYMPERTSGTLRYMDTTCIDKPIILEEFGALGWNNPENYDANVHNALGAGAAAAMSYEWGISWLAREHCFHPLPLREALVENPDPRWFPPYNTFGTVWTDKGVGLCGHPSGTGYGSIYHGTPFTAEAAEALGRLGRMGAGLARAATPERTYVVVPGLAPDPKLSIAMVTVEATMNELSQEKALFGVWRETELASLPDSARVVICPAGVVTEEGKAALEALRGRGVEVYEKDDAGWRNSAHIERVAVTPGEGIDLLPRRTLHGTLYVLRAKEAVPAVEVGLSRAVSLGLDTFAMVHDTEAGIALVEGTGAISIGGQSFCTVSAGRAILAVEGAGDLSNANALRGVVTEPTRIEFTRPVAALAVSDGYDAEPVPVPGFAAGSKVLDVDSEMSRYVLHIRFD